VFPQPISKPPAPGSLPLTWYRIATTPKVIGLAEFMNVPGVLNKDPECMEKLAAFQGQHIDGHAPLLSGRA
jgi:adenine deaminase